MTAEPPASAAAIVMGVAGSGKTHIGRMAAERLGWTFFDGDDFHPQSNLTKMRAGIALTDADREPWLETLNQLLRSSQIDGAKVVLAYSGLKRSHRRSVAEGVTNLRIVHLDVPQSVITERVSARQGHFLSSVLVPSQFADFEPPESDEATIIDADRPMAAVVDAVVEALQSWVVALERPAQN